ncbi:MAG: DUF3857 domain-containing protein [Planctomycetota bacterium]
MLARLRRELGFAASWLVAWLALSGTSVHAAAGELWDDAFLRGDFLGSFEEHSRRLGAPPHERPSWAATLAPDLYAELELRFFASLARRVQDAPRALATFDRFLEHERGPEVTGLARELRAHQLLACGDVAAATDEWRRLGFLRSWFVVGPFENERGSGFEVPLPPEERWGPDETYVGKRGRVGWREFSETGPGGAIELGEILRPNQEAIAYLACFVHAAEPMDLQLRVGSSGSYAIWIDSVEVARNDIERTLGFDQDLHAIHVGRGWHSVLVKSGQTRGDWRLRVRVTQPDGTPAWGAVDSPSDADPPRFSAQASRPDTAEPIGGEVRRLAPPRRASDAALAQAQEHPQATALAAFLTRDLGAHDRHEHPDRDALAPRIAAGAGTAVDYYLLALTYDQAITHDAEREQNAWRQALERALAIDPGFHAVRIELARYSLERFGNTSTALEILAPAMGQKPWPADLVTLLASVQAQRHGDAERELLWAEERPRLTREPWLDFRLELARTALTQGRLDEAAELVRAGLGFAADHAELLELSMQIAIRRGDVDGAREHLHTATRLWPVRSAPWRKLADFETTCGNWSAALAAIERALVIAPQEEQVHQARAEILLLSGKREAALDGFRAALELEPNQPRLREYLAHLDETVASHREPLAEPLAERIAAARAAAATGDDPVHELLHNQIVRIAIDGTTRRFVQYLARVGNDQGIRRLDYYSVPYAHGEQWVKVVTARAHAPDGAVEEATIRNRDPQVREGEYPTWAYAWVDLPPLRPGTIVEIEYWVEDLRQSFFGDYFGDRVPLAGLEPRDFVGYTLIAPKDKPLYFATQQATPGATEVVHTVAEDPDTKTYRWVATQQPRLDPEPGMPPVQELVPTLQISTFRDWDAFATWYHHLIRKQFDSSPAIRAKVAELTRDCRTDWEKTRAVYDFVVSDVRYVAWEFGIHGFQPYRASTIFTRRFGDCKDKATLICVMLAEVGIEAHPVLINGTQQRPREDFTLPLIDHFNHCIAFVPSLGENGLFLDGTAEHHAVDELPLMDRGAKVLVVQGDGGRVTDIPWNRPEEFAIDERQTLTLRDDGAAALAIDARPTGALAVSLRSGLEIEGERKRQLERRFGSQFPGATVEVVEATDFTNLNEPVRLQVRVKLPRYLDDTREGIKLPALRDFFGLGGAFANRADPGTRKFDLLLGNPLRSSLEVAIELPPDHEVSHLPESVKFASPFGNYSLDHRLDGRTIHVRRQLEVTAPRVPAEDYAQFKRFVADVEESRAERIVLRRTQEEVQ